MIYRETLKDRRYDKIQYSLAKKKLEQEYKIIQKILDVPNAYTMGNIFVFLIAVFFFYIVIHKFL